MFKVKNSVIVAKDNESYLSFPDIIQSKDNPNQFFLIYRSGNAHHPTWSYLHLMVSKNRGRTWKEIKSFPLSLERDGKVWNCPRFSYLDNNTLPSIVCDTKDGVIERKAKFETFIIKPKYKYKFFHKYLTNIPGMLPDRVIKFKDKLFCANHKIKSIKNDLVQLVTWSRDNGATWFDTNIIAHDLEHQYCEASIVNMGEFLVAYLRDNSKHKRPIYYVSSRDGISWSNPVELPLFGQRVTANREGKNVIGAYRQTDSCQVSIFNHDLDSGEIIDNSPIDWEYPKMKAYIL